MPAATQALPIADLRDPHYEQPRYNTALTIRSRQGSVYNRILKHVKPWLTERIPAEWPIDAILAGHEDLYNEGCDMVGCARFDHDSDVMWALEVRHRDLDTLVRDRCLVTTRLSLYVRDGEATLLCTSSWTALPGAELAFTPGPQVPNVINDVLADAKLDVTWYGFPIGTKHTNALFLDADGIRKSEKLADCAAGANIYPVVVLPHNDEIAMRAAGYLVGLALPVVIDVPEDEPWPDEIGSAFAEVFHDKDVRPGADFVGVYPSRGTGRPFFACTSEFATNDLIYLIQARLAIISQWPCGSGLPVVETVNDVLAYACNCHEDKLKQRIAELENELAEREQKEAHAAPVDEHVVAELEQKLETSQASESELKLANFKLRSQLEALQNAPKQDAEIDRERLASLMADDANGLVSALMLAEALWPDRIAVHEDAWKSAKGFALKSTGEAITLVMAMATELWRDYFDDGLDSETVEDAFYRQTTFELAEHESSMTRKDNRLMHLREHDIDGETVVAEAHVKGKRNDDLRVYYWPDQKKKLVRIVYAGDHLETYGSHHFRAK